MTKLNDLINLYKEFRLDFEETYDFKEVKPEIRPQPGIRFLHFSVCLNPESLFYGMGRGAFIWQEKELYAFDYNIHTPSSKGPQRSNQAVCIKRIAYAKSYGMPYIKIEDTGFAALSLWIHTPDTTLNKPAYAVRCIIKDVQAFCRWKDYCARLRKTDKRHLSWLARQEGD